MDLAAGATTIVLKIYNPMLGVKRQNVARIKINLFCYRNFVTFEAQQILLKMIHLIKYTYAKTSCSILLPRLACVNNPFIKGKMVPLNEFILLNNNIKCKKCLSISIKQQLKQQSC